VPLQHVQPSPSLTPRDVVNSVMAALHRTNWDTPKPYYGFEVALRFLAPSHMAKQNSAKPGGYARYLRQPHKVGMILWNEFRFEGDTILLEGSNAPDEAYQMCSVRSSPTDEWTAARWKLVKVTLDFGESSFSQWMVEAVFANEPDQYSDQPLKLLGDPPPPPPPAAAAAAAKEVTSLENAWGDADAWNEQVSLADAWGAGAQAWANQWDVVPEETPQQVISKVMAALRTMNDPYPLAGAEVATRYCSPQNRASELSPEVFARYLTDPWYSILAEWDDMEEEDDDDDDDDDDDEDGGNKQGSKAEVEVLVKREGEASYSMVSWCLSLHDANWLIDSMNIV